MPTPNDPPLFDFKWTEGAPHAQWERSLLCVIAVNRQGVPSVVGTAFVIGHSADGRRANCMTAAHVFSEVHRLQNEASRHASSALSEFLPPPKLIDIDPGLVRVIGWDGDRVEIPEITALSYDEDSDIAYFQVQLQDSSQDGFFCSNFGVSGDLPSVGEVVSVLSYADLSMEQKENYGGPGYWATLNRRLKLRTGRVLAHYPSGQRLCKGPCIETSIPVFSGMSGGPLMIWATDGPMVASALVSSDPDLDTDAKNDQNIEGRSIFAALPVLPQAGTKNAANAELLLPVKGSVGTFRNE
ncbi:S1 family peptidase [Achromobacter xylosoxidans]|uniref:S1 family peptidase n=1 Tax=Alcaligenes xylosoxydans xylosoxydans TaxID=85698 RepID=UPI001EE9E44C|nr:serine protease [Achromobacter xylosoxidans]